MKKRDIIFTLLMIGFNVYYCTSQTTSVSGTPAPSHDNSKDYIGGGFTLSAIAGGLYGANPSATYHLVIDDSYSNKIFEETYKMKSSIGYQVGVGIGFQTRKFGMELPITMVVDRYKVKEISNETMKIPAVELGLNSYFKLFKDKHYILFGPYVSLPFKNVDGVRFGANAGYGYNFTKRLNVSLRYKFNFSSLSSKTDGTIELHKTDGEDEKGNTIVGGNLRNNSLQLIVRFDLINTRRLKVYHEPPPPPLPPPLVVHLDYSNYTKSALEEALKNANAAGDTNAVNDIQKEISSRKAKDPFYDSTDQQLQDELKKVLQEENYDRAEVLKNELKKRNAFVAPK